MAQHARKCHAAKTLFRGLSRGLGIAADGRIEEEEGMAGGVVWGGGGERGGEETAAILGGVCYTRGGGANTGDEKEGGSLVYVEDTSCRGEMNACMCVCVYTCMSGSDEDFCLECLRIE